MSKSKSRKSLKKQRKVAFIKQRGRCYYCKSLMWLNDPSELTNTINMSRKQSLKLQCTGEHLIPHSEGGSAGPDNIVAACWYCNQGRHGRKIAPSPQKFREFVHARLAKKRWNFTMTAGL